MIMGSCRKQNKYFIPVEPESNSTELKTFLQEQVFIQQQMRTYVSDLLAGVDLIMPNQNGANALPVNGFINVVRCLKNRLPPSLMVNPLASNWRRISEVYPVTNSDL